MDIKDIIKWLFQVKSPSTNTRTPPSEPKNVSRMCSIVATTAILLCFVNTIDANDSFFDASTLQHANLKTQFQDALIEGQKFQFRTENGNETKTNEPSQIETNVKNSIEQYSKSEYGAENNLNAVENGIVLSNDNGIDLGIEQLNQITLSTVTSSVFGIIDGSVAYLDGLLERNMGSETARTFGRPLRKLQSALLPIMFKLGVIATLIFLTFLLSLKAVAIGLLLLLFKVAGIIATFKAGLVSHHGHGHDAWSPHKEVHLHIHNTDHGISGAGHESAYYPTTGFDPWSRQDTLPSPASLIQQHHQPASYPSVASYPAAQIAGPVSINTPYGHYVRTGGPTAAGYST